MIRFIDEQSYTTFNGDSPYVFWFNEGLSTNINHVKRILLASDNPTLHIVCQSDVFHLIDVSQLIPSNQTIVNGHTYYDLEHLTTDNLVLQGTAHNGKYVYCLHFLARTNLIGEHTDTFTIYAVNATTETLEGSYTIGGDFYTGDELLTANLTNRGFEIPDEFLKGIYDTNVREDATHNIVRNRKFKELLYNFFDVVVTEGGYSALSKSLEFWEYGPLVKMRDFWKHYDFNKYFYEYIQRLAGMDFQDTIRSQVKSTYIGLYFALSEVGEIQGTTIPYENTAQGVFRDRGQQQIPASAITDNINQPMLLLNDAIPILYEVAKKWTTEDITLKMTVLGDFYRSYFTPIHLDLQHSTVEQVVYPELFKMLNGQYMTRHDFFDSIHPLEMTIESTYMMGAVECYVYDDTLFGNNYYQHINPNTVVPRPETDPGITTDTTEAMLPETNDPLSSYGVGYQWQGETTQMTDIPPTQVGSYDGWVGVDYRRPGPISDPDNMTLSTYNTEEYWRVSEVRYGGIGCIADIHIVIHDPGTIVREVCTWRGEGTVRTNTFRDGVYVPEFREDVVTRISQNVYQGNDGVITIDFSLLFRASGWHNVLLEFDSTSGHTYCKQFNINITDEVIPTINVFKLQRDNDALNEFIEIEDIEDEEERELREREFFNNRFHRFNLYSMLTRDATMSYAWRYGQFVATSEHPASVGFNHYICLIVNNIKPQIQRNYLDNICIAPRTSTQSEDVRWFNAYRTAQSENTAQLFAEEYVRQLQALDDRYWWWCEEVIIRSDYAVSPQRWVIRGVSKFFTMPDDPRNLMVTGFVPGMPYRREAVYSSEGCRFIDDCRFFAIFNKVVDFVTDEAFMIDREETVLVIPCILHTSPQEIEDDQGVLQPGTSVREPLFLSFLPLSYGAWSFINYSKGEHLRNTRENGLVIPVPDYFERNYFDVTTPLIFNFEPALLERGYYTVELRYKLGNHPDENLSLVRKVTKDSAFAVK